MITIQKQNVVSGMVAEYMATAHAANEKIRFFERKYAQTWEEFSKSVQEAPNEDFQRWDDYIEWKGQIKIADELALKSTVIQNESAK